MTPIVVGASVVLGLALADEAVDPGVAELLRGHALIAPDLFAYEVANVVTGALRRGRITVAQSHRVIADVEGLGVALQPPSGIDPLFAVATQAQLSAYDAAYLDLAMRVGCPLLTADRALATAATAAGVEVLGAG